ncbi:MAG TPA: sugar phosphate isomerase/epimerase family protein [Gaiellaceae bacterium]|nr:sugar phosphate isomerase/epimerase family protein [Gaiellaceae bacterium]
MNDPALPLGAELERIAGSGFDFADITLEPPAAWPITGRELSRLLSQTGLRAVGHTAYYLPIASHFPQLRAAAHASFRDLLDTFAEAGITEVNVHPDPMTKLVSRDTVAQRNAEAIAELAEVAAARGQRLMVENLGTIGRVEDLRPIFAAAPSVGLHLDVAHANLLRLAGEPNRTVELLAAFGDRLLHVHVSDNFGVEDLHLPLGAGSIDWPVVIAALKRARWDGTVTIEIFTSQPAHLETSRRLWLEWWRAADERL